MNEIESTSSVFDFDPLAGEYDNWYKTAEGRLYDMLEKRVLRRLIGEIGSGAGMLEVGMGTGWWSRFFVQLGYHVTGVDISPEMVKTARSRNIPNAVFDVADAQQLSFPDNGFDAATAITSLEFVKNSEKAILEMVRCTRPGGKLFIGVLNAESSLNKLRKTRKEGPYSNAHFFTSDELRSLLDPLGRTTIRMCAFPLALKLPAAVAGIADNLQASIGRTDGAFIAARVEL